MLCRLWGTILLKFPTVPNFAEKSEKPWGTILENTASVPNASNKLVPIKWTRLLQFCPIRSWLHPVLGHWIAPINFWLHPVLNNGLHQ